MQDKRGKRNRRIRRRVPVEKSSARGGPITSDRESDAPSVNPNRTALLASEEDAAPWHALTVEQAYARLETGPRGLGAESARERLTEHGFNELAEQGRVSVLRLLLSQFANVLTLILLLAIGISAYLGWETEAIVIAVIVLFSVLLGFFQEYRAENAVAALRQLTAPTATVLRDGVEQAIAASLLVPGDLVRLTTGSRVPADIRLVEARSLQTDEAALTGESTPVGKHAELTVPAAAGIGERCNLAFSGTLVTHGKALGVVVATGMDTEFGQVVRMLGQAAARKTPLQNNLDRVGRHLAVFALAIVAVICAQGVVRGESLVEMLIFGFALAVAVVPEALPAVVTVSLAIGARRMAARHALIRRLPAVETLGCTSVICSDKTGTLTRDEMTVRKILTAERLATLSGTGYEPFGRLIFNGESIEPSPLETAVLQAAVLCSDAELVSSPGSRAAIKGDPTEAALIVAAAKIGLKKAELERQSPRIDEIPFSSESKRMTTLHRIAAEGRVVAYAKGAAEVILAACTHQLVAGDQERLLDEMQRSLILEQAHELADQALRVLAVARKSDAALATAEQGMVFLGLVGMIDPPRSESQAAVAMCEQAGIKVVMITGDHPSTARAVAREVGILKSGRLVTGRELEALDDRDLQHLVAETDVYARVSPKHKLRVVEALQKNGQVVAMTGDGVNDAPALKRADIGIAMGITGTDVSREAAAMILTDDNFASIVAAVEEGRGIFNNIRKYLMYLLAANIGEIGLVASAALLGLPMPLSAVQILYVNLATDGLPALALALDPNESDLMRRSPRDPLAGIFTGPVVTLMVAGGVWSMLVNLGLFFWASQQPQHTEAMAMTIVFAALVLTEFFKAFSYRSYDRSVFSRTFSNRWLNLAIVWELALLLALIYVPPLQELFGTVSLDGFQWLVIAGAAFSIIPTLEVVKWWSVRRRPSGA